MGTVTQIRHLMSIENIHHKHFIEYTSRFLQSARDNYGLVFDASFILQPEHALLVYSACVFPRLIP